MLQNHAGISKNMMKIFSTVYKLQTKLYIYSFPEGT